MFLRSDNWISQEEILHTLNSEPPRPKRTDSQVLKLALMVHEDGSPWFGPGDRLPQYFTPEDARRIGARLVKHHLQDLVDKWLDTGCKPDGSESPVTRDLQYAEAPVFHALTRSKGAQPIFTPIIDKDGIRFEAFFRLRPMFLFDIEKPGRLFSPPPVEEPFEGFVEAEERRSANFFEEHFVQATRLFLGMMASDWKDRLCKCRYKRCGRYFVLGRKPNAYYKHGTFCRVHQQNWSAARSVYEKRRREASSLLDAAARLLIDQKRGADWLDEPRNKRRLAGDISRQLSSELGRTVKANWVTQNRPKIEQRRVELTKAAENVSS